MQELKRFDSQHIAFGRHETFPIRYGWLTKGFQAVTENPKIFNDDKATVKLGVGKNMVSAIHYWLQAARLICSDSAWKPTPLGEKIFSNEGWDPYLEDEATLWLLHWLMASNPEKATGIFWFFNLFHKSEFTEAEAFSALKAFIKLQGDNNRADSTLKIDINVILRMYAPSWHDKGTLSEEALDSPLSILKLINRNQDKTYSAKSEAHNVPYPILGFAIAELFRARPHDTGFNLRELLHSDGYWPALGGIFRVTENHLLTLLEELTTNYTDFYELRDTAGIHQLYRKPSVSDLNPLLFLEQHYKYMENPT